MRLHTITTTAIAGGRVCNYPIFSEDNVLVANVKADDPRAKELVALLTDPRLQYLTELCGFLEEVILDHKQHGGSAKLRETVHKAQKLYERIHDD